jgi:hypothetical protein
MDPGMGRPRQLADALVAVVDVVVTTNLGLAGPLIAQMGSRLTQHMVDQFIAASSPTVICELGNRCSRSLSL